MMNVVTLLKMSYSYWDIFVFFLIVYSVTNLNFYFVFSE